MAKVITFSRTYPAYHPKAGQPTYFMEKFWNSFPDFPPRKSGHFFKKCAELNPLFDTPTKQLAFYDSVKYGITEVKHHTVRLGCRFKAGDYFSPRVWGTNVNAKNGRTGPYQSDQIIIGLDTLITHTYDLVLHKHPQKFGDDFAHSHIGYVSPKHNQLLFDDHLDLVAPNDGLTVQDFKDWLLPPIIKGKEDTVVAQIICWNKTVDYDNHPDWLPF